MNYLRELEKTLIELQTSLDTVIAENTALKKENAQLMTVCSKLLQTSKELETANSELTKQNKLLMQISSRL